MSTLDALKTASAALLAAIAELERGAPSGSPLIAPPLLEFHPGSDDDWSQKTELVQLGGGGEVRYFKEDYRYTGHPGAFKGVDQSLWGAANTALATMGESKPHLYVVTLCTPQPDGGNWRLATKSVADAGWVDGHDFMPGEDVGGALFARWDVAGRPSISGDGFQLQRGGAYVTNSAGQKVPAGADPGFKVGP